MLSIGTLQVARRKSFVLVMDSLTQDSFSDATEVIGENGLWVSATEINKIRIENPDANYYGLWQVILHNKLVKTPGIYFVKTGEHSGSATEFIEVEGKIVATRTFNVADSSSNESGLRKEKLINLDLDIKKLKLPKIGILRAEEFREIKLKNEKNVNRFLALYILAMIVSIFVYLDKSNKIAINNERLEQELALTDIGLISQKNDADISRISVYPNDAKILNRMLGVLYIDPDARSDGEQDLSTGVTLFISGDQSRENRFMKAGESFVRYPTGEFKVVLNVD